MIYLECYPDRILVETLGIQKKEIKHVFSKGNVCNRLERDRNSKGLVDEDPLSAQPNYLSKLRLVLKEENIKLLYDERSQNYLIVLCPTLEEWTLNVVRKAGVDIGEYGLPNDASELHKIINTKIKNFKNLIEDIKQNRILKTLEDFIKKEVEIE